MILSYDPYLVALSILIAITAAYTCFHLVDSLTRLYGAKWKATLFGAAVSIGGGIWSTHFVGMLALNLSVTVTYDILETLISALLAISFTALALYLSTLHAPNLRKTLICGILMGLGISAMHFMGMGAIIANCIITYDPIKVMLSVMIGIVASTLAIHLSLKLKKKGEQFQAAIAMGLGIACMHYSGMYSASFNEISDAVLIEQVSLDRSILAIIITVISFVLFASTFLLATPSPDAPDHNGTNQFASHESIKVTVQSPKGQIALEPREIRFIHANGRYSEISTDQDKFFCDLSISKLDDMLAPFHFLRVHRSYLVNLLKITCVDHQKDRGFLMFGPNDPETQVPVSRRKIEILKSELRLRGIQL